MKRNVDLTEDMKFIKRPPIPVLIGEIFTKLPKYFNKQAKPFTPQGKTMIYIGNKHERKTRKFCDTFCEPTENCDACGCLIKFPWDRGVGGLCLKCDTRHDNDYIMNLIRGVRL